MGLNKKNKDIITDNGWNEIYYNDGEGSIKARFFKKNGKMEGIVKFYYESEQLKTEANFKNGKAEGIGKGYYESGQLKEESNYKNGKKEDIGKTYYESGQLKS